MNLDNDRDRMIHILLEESVGGMKPPDLSGKILARAYPRRRRIPRWAAACIAASFLIAVIIFGWWLLHKPAPEPDSPSSYPSLVAWGDYGVQDGGPLERGSTLFTDAGSATVKLGGYCTIEMAPQSRLRIEGAEYTEAVFLDRGSISCNVIPQRGSFIVETEVGTVTVTGTEFTVRIIELKGEPKMKKMFVHVLVGTVVLAGAWGQIPLTAGESKTVFAAEDPVDVLEKAPKFLIGTRGGLVGFLNSVDGASAVLEVSDVTKSFKAQVDNTKAHGWFIGKTVKVSGSGRGIYAKKMAETLKLLHKSGKPVLVLVNIVPDGSLKVYSATQFTPK